LRIRQKADEAEDGLAGARDEGEREIEKKIQDRMVAFKDGFFKKLRAAGGA
jgi:hypothetical protein